MAEAAAAHTPAAAAAAPSSSSSSSAASASSASASSSSHAGSGGLHLTLVVIGKVTHSTARILVEMLEGGNVTCRLTKVKSKVRTLNGVAPDPTRVADEAGVLRAEPLDPASPVTSNLVVTQELRPARPRIFKFEGLEPNARYAVSFDSLAHAQPASSFVTMMEDWKVGPEHPGMRIATISCNLLSETLALKETQTDLWQDLADRVQRGEVDYVLHMGDQVYADEARNVSDHAPIVSAFATEAHEEVGEGGVDLDEKDHFVFKKAANLIKKSGARTPEQFRALHPQIEELYRELYRETWSHPPTQKVLANVPNLSIYDDHDFVDNWGTLAIHHDRSSAEFSVGLCARQVYFEYQDSLHRDVAPEDVASVEDDHHFHVFGEIGFVFTESRGAQSFRYEKDRSVPFLGVRQWADLESALNPTTGLFKNVRHLVVVCPCPVVYLPHGLNAAMEPMVEDAQGHWAAKPFIPEQTRMLNLCLAWQEGPDFAERVKDIEAAEKPAMVGAPVQERGAYRTTYESLTGRPEKSVASGVLEKSLCTSNRRLTLVGGDVHVGGHTRIFKHGHLVLEQLVSSAIANHILPAVAFAIASMVQNVYTKLEDGWEFQHQPYTRQRNYGLVDMSAPEVCDKPTVATHIISAD